TAGATFASTAGHLVLSRPGAPLRLFLRDAALLVSLLDVLSLTFLLIGVCGFVAAGHGGSFPARLAPWCLRGCKANTATCVHARERARKKNVQATCATPALYQY